MKPSSRPLRPFGPLGPLNGQALVEFAIFGSLFLMALAFLVQIGLRMNYQQEIEQQTFRRAMNAAQQEGDEESQLTTYYQVRQRQIPDPSDGFAVQPRVRTESSATVVWSEFLTFLDRGRDSQPRTLVHLDNADETNSVLVVRSEDLKKQQIGSTAECSAYYHDCIDSCNEDDPDDNAECIEQCQEAENDACHSLPLVRHIDQTLHSSGELTQDHAAGTDDTATRMNSTSTTSTTMILNTRNESSVSSEVTSNVSRDWQ